MTRKSSEPYHTTAMAQLAQLSQNPMSDEAGDIKTGKNQDAACPKCFPSFQCAIA